jgi:homospermidine synthase
MDINLVKYLKYKQKYLNLKYKQKHFFSNIDEHVFFDYNTYDKRKQKVNELFNNKRKFNNKIYIFGMGAIGIPLLWLLLKILDINPQNIIVIEERDILDEIKETITEPINIIINTSVDINTYKKILQDLSENDIIIDAATDIDTLFIMELCQEKGANYINSAINNEWSDENNVNNINKNLRSKEEILKSTIYNIHKKLENYNNSVTNKNFNSILCMGCNPGNVSLWCKLGLINIAKNKNIDHKEFEKKGTLNLLSQKIGIEVIHISEKDTQIIDNPKKDDEYCNTWSKTMDSYYSEALSNVELSLGTHERNKNKFNEDDILLKNDEFLILDKFGSYTFAQSWIPYYDKIIGNVICHDESYTIGHKLSVYDENQNIIYKPSVYYVYNPCNAAELSLNELKKLDENYQSYYRLLTSEIIDGNDILGLTYFLEDKKYIYWIGSLLGIEESRNLFDNKLDNIINATILQVIAGYLTGIMYLMDLSENNIKKGLIEAEDIPLEYMKYQLPFLGDFIFTKKEDYKINKLYNKVTSDLVETNEWTFSNFMI